IGTPVISDIPTDEHVVERAIEVPSTEETITTTEVTTTQEETLPAVAVTEEVLHQALVTAADTEIVEEAEKQEHQPVVLEPTTELADRVSTDALTDAVREIIATPVISDIPAHEHVIEPAVEVPWTEETITNTEFTTTQEERLQPVAVAEEILHQPLVTTTDTE
ncbi:unnamed protein product, partial [Rotaria magnacalcarata]